MRHKEQPTAGKRLRFPASAEFTVTASIAKLIKDATTIAAAAAADGDVDEMRKTAMGIDENRAAAGAKVFKVSLTGA